MSLENYQDKRQMFTQAITSIIREELNEAIAYEMSMDIDTFVTNILQRFVVDNNSEESKNDEIIEYRSNMDNFYY